MTEAIGTPAEEWVTRLRELKTHADLSRDLAKRRWDEAWRIYNNQYDWSAKADWQAKNFVPKVGMSVEMAASLVRRAILDADDWFRLEGVTESSRVHAPYLEKLLYYYLDRLRFADRFIEPLKGGFVGSLIVVKPHLAPYTTRGFPTEPGEVYERELVEGPAVTVSFPDPYNIWLDPSGRNLFVIEEEVMDLAMAHDLVDMGILDGDAIRKVQEDWVESEKEVRESARRQQSPEAGRPSFRREVKLTHFWGSMPTKEGRWSIRNGHLVVVNDKYLGRGPQENPYVHKQIPYIVGSPFRRPFSVYHKGLVEDVVGLQKAMTELLNLTLDSALFAGIKAFEVDLDQIEDPQQLLNGIYPGKVFTKRGAGAQHRMIQDIEISGVSRETIGLWNLLNVEYQNSTAVTEFISGFAGHGGARTATEVVTKQTQGMGLFSEIGRNLEGTVLEPMLEQMAALVVQYHDDFMDPKVAEILGDDLMVQLMLASAEAREDIFDPQHLRVRASGITSLLNRGEEIQKIMTIMQGLGQFGPGMQIIMSEIDVPYFFRGLFQRLVRAHGWNEKDLIRPAATPPMAPVQPGQPMAGGGPELAVGQPAPPPVAQTQAQIAQIRGAIAGGGLPPSPVAAAQ
jgi:hypothetical protein